MPSTAEKEPKVLTFTVLDSSGGMMCVQSMYLGASHAETSTNRARQNDADRETDPCKGTLGKHGQVP